MSASAMAPWQIASRRSRRRPVSALYWYSCTAAAMAVRGSAVWLVMLQRYARRQWPGRGGWRPRGVPGRRLADRGGGDDTRDQQAPEWRAGSDPASRPGRHAPGPTRSSPVAGPAPSTGCTPWSPPPAPAQHDATSRRRSVPRPSQEHRNFREQGFLEHCSTPGRPRPIACPWSRRPLRAAGTGMTTRRHRPRARVGAPRTAAATS